MSSGVGSGSGGDTSAPDRRTVANSTRPGAPGGQLRACIGGPARRRRHTHPVVHMAHVFPVCGPPQVRAGPIPHTSPVGKQHENYVVRSPRLPAQRNPEFLYKTGTRHHLAEYRRLRPEFLDGLPRGPLRLFHALTLGPQLTPQGNGYGRCRRRGSAGCSRPAASRSRRSGRDCKRNGSVSHSVVTLSCPGSLLLV